MLYAHVCTYYMSLLCACVKNAHGVCMCVCEKRTPDSYVCAYVCKKRTWDSYVRVYVCKIRTQDSYVRVYVCYGTVLFILLLLLPLLLVGEHTTQPGTPPIPPLGVVGEHTTQPLLLLLGGGVVVGVGWGAYHPHPTPPQPHHHHHHLAPWW